MVKLSLASLAIFSLASAGLNPPVTIQLLETISQNLEAGVTPFAVSINQTVANFNFFDIPLTQSELSKDIIGIINLMFNASSQVQLASIGSEPINATIAEVKAVTAQLQQSLKTIDTAIDKITQFSYDIPVVGPFIEALDANFKILSGVILNSISSVASQLDPTGPIINVQSITIANAGVATATSTPSSVPFIVKRTITFSRRRLTEKHSALAKRMYREALAAEEEEDFE